jgi:hypothetical protein
MAQEYSQGCESCQGLEISQFTTTSRLALGPTQPPIQWVPGALSLGLKWPVHKADHSSPSSAEVKECVELYLHSPKYAIIAWCSVKSTGMTLPLPLPGDRQIQFVSVIPSEL